MKLHVILSRLRSRPRFEMWASASEIFSLQHLGSGSSIFITAPLHFRPAAGAGVELYFDSGSSDLKIRRRTAPAPQPCFYQISAVHRLGKGLAMYDAFVLSGDGDEEFMMELVCTMERQGLTCCIKDRDLLGKNRLTAMK